jgi:hypothetical protein
VATQVKTGDVIETTVRLSDDADVRFSVHRKRDLVLQNLPGQFVYSDRYAVAESDERLQYAWFFLFNQQQGMYSIELRHNGILVDGAARRGVDGAGPFGEGQLFWKAGSVE